MKKLGIVITDGVGYRNFIMSNFMQEAVQQFDQIIIYSGLPASIYALEQYPQVTVHELEVYHEGHVSFIFRKWKEIAHMEKSKSNFGMSDNNRTNYPKTNSLKNLVVKFFYVLSRIYSSNGTILFAEKLQFLAFSKNKITQSYIQLLKKDQPDLVFFTHQRPSYLAPFLYAAQRVKIPTCSFIFSWDNLASKGRMLGTFDYFLVWSQLMKDELLQFYPNTNPEGVKIVGTPQFEPYFLPHYQTEREAFLKRFQLDPAKKIICFSCADKSIGGNDPLIIKTIAEAIRNGKLEQEAQLLVRTSPAEEPSRFEAIRSAYPEIIWNNPKWIQTRSSHDQMWSQRIPSEEDIFDLRAIIEHSDINVNMLSTMSLDFMLFGKPVINTVFGTETNGLYNDSRFLKYAHIKTVLDCKATRIATQESELIAALNTYLVHPQTDAKERQQLIEIEVCTPLAGISNRMAQQLYEWC
ncbi:glycosyltransferase family protein [Flavobacterium stagni]|uniref:UDP-glycosyltransferase n=1 Tax=Flavobacterium stagni TaxID=2506421 RepID=A0A4Q1K7R1_9FLAO|nr:hypothetical protein [Flavobacterium stagni]RXR21858.1 hypothetical protein EQG61_10260 [Flavobacterium stagni]